MKIRNGFVSNSSSSSFLLIGCDTNLVKEEIIEKFQSRDSELDIFYLENKKHNKVIGKVIYDCEEYYDITYLSYNDINDTFKKVSESLNVPIENIELMTGVRPS